MTNGQDENCFRMRSSPQIAKKAATDPVAGPTASRARTSHGHVAEDFLANRLCG